MSKENLKLRLLYFEKRLEEAKRKHAAKESPPRSFDQGYKKEIFTSWPESIASINKQILSIQFQLKAKSSKQSGRVTQRKGYDAL
jgi:hypothetical protein